MTVERKTKPNQRLRRTALPKTCIILPKISKQNKRPARGLSQKDDRRCHSNPNPEISKNPVPTARTYADPGNICSPKVAEGSGKESLRGRIWCECPVTFHNGK
ncbi:hypothetical protein CDAR_317991 [Caerostris darwini]|uniref:Uncharacterized protein n=1 Tax=Caerostris darwini TaxID=1538125 RepID=A0AAV4WRM0_9ARAC|nr:hypothetical protein CDAR_317991 [Caerostris darwini]